MIQKLLKADNNLLSFLCGIISNVPISIIFSIQPYGTTLSQHIYFFVWLLTFILSFTLTMFAFIITLRKIKIQNELDRLPPADKETNLKKLYENNKRYLFVKVLLFIIIFIVLCLSVIALWVIKNFIGC